MDKQELKAILDKHLKWLRDEDGGKRANLFGADLSRANLSGANLFGANQKGAYVCWNKDSVKTDGLACML